MNPILESIGAAAVRISQLEAAIAERDATIERLRSELEAEQARTICATCGKELTMMAQEAP